MLKITNLTNRPLPIEYAGCLKPHASDSFDIRFSDNLKNLERCGAIYVEQVQPVPTIGDNGKVRKSKRNNTGE